VSSAIYVVRADSNRSKIGMSDKPLRRLAELKINTRNANSRFPTLQPSTIAALHDPERFQMRVSPGFIRLIDEWRRKQPDLPSRAESLRRLVEIAVASERRKPK
jgi:hypothetical protein